MDGRNLCYVAESPNMFHRAWVSLHARLKIAGAVDNPIRDDISLPIGHRTAVF